MIEVSLLGTGGMVPLHNRFLTSMVLRCNGSMLLVDCGEGTQVTLKQLGWGFKRLDYICFTHLHADHISGLPGLLLTIGNSDRTEPLTIIGPRRIQEVVQSLRVIAPELPFSIRFIELPYKKNAAVSCMLGELKMSALRLHHTMECIGYSFFLGRAGKFDADRAKQQDIPIRLWSKLQKGETVEQDGKIYTPDMVLGENRKGIKISYMTDTRPTALIPQFIADSDLFICEGLYGDDEMQQKAKDHKHMVFSEAAELAKKGNVNELWLTHFSPAMPNPTYYARFAKRIFENAHVGYDRMTKTCLFEGEDEET